MIGVIANPADEGVVCEFFELFKTPWEFYREGESYEVVLCAGVQQLEVRAAKLLLIYAGRCLSSDTADNIPVALHDKDARLLSYQGRRLPIYGDCVCFPQDRGDILVHIETRRPAASVQRGGGSTRVRIGYDLFSEIRTLLTAGQPPDHANIPTLELHIALLRDLIIASGAALVEIPPVPEGYAFIACLTHDVDHPSVRHHRFDHTMFGFLYRAIFGSVLDVARNRASFSDLLSNWAAALKLPLVHIGLADDFWLKFQDYPKVEGGAPSSFFVIPFKGRPGHRGATPAPKRRAARYGAADIAAQIRTLMAAGCEIGLHGIDAWGDSSRGREELEEIQRVTGVRDIGVRMHWLYFDEQSPLNLERAGAAYDSTVGYNQAVGFRAGTMQAYKPLQAKQLLELPLHVMDTALFYPSRLNISPAEAKLQVGDIIDHAVRFGGSVTVNWHDRSLAPERQWGRFYVELIDDLKSRGAWFSTASQAVAWFRKRRSAVFETIGWESDRLRVKVAVDGKEELPPLRLHIHKPGSGAAGATAATSRGCDIQMSLSGSIDTVVSLAGSREPANSPR